METLLPMAPRLSVRVAERFDKALKTIRLALAEGDLSVVGEIDVTARPAWSASRKAGASRLLLVDSPLLVFEALALDRAAGVFFPLHLLVSASGEETLVSWPEPSVLLDLRLPAGAAEPLDELRARVTAALDTITSPSETNRPSVEHE